MRNFLKFRTETILVFLVLLGIASVFAAVAGEVGTWDGEPSFYTRSVQETVNRYVAAQNAEKSGASAFLQCFSAFPKMLYPIIQSWLILLTNGLEPVEFATAEAYGIWTSIAATFVGLAAVYVFVRTVCPVLPAMFSLVLLGFSGYFILYATFPRHNMMAHAISWLAVAIHAQVRISKVSLPPLWSLLIGLLFGIAVATHYSSAYLGLWLAVAEIVLLVRDRRVLRTLGAGLLMVAGAMSVWISIDAWFLLRLADFPNVIHWFGMPITEEFSFFNGLAHTLNRLHTRAMDFKLAPTTWSFLPGFWLRDISFVGVVLLTLGTFNALRPREIAFVDAHWRARVFVLTGLVCSIIISLQFFQSARKLMPFAPAWTALIGLGFLWVNDKLQHFNVRSRFRAGALAGVLLVAHVIIFGSEGRTIYDARRDIGKMRAYLAQKNIDAVLILTVTGDDGVIGKRQANLWTTPRKDRSSFDYLLVNRLLPELYDKQFIKCMRRLRPVVSYPNQAGLELFWYEFPLKREYLDQRDPLVTNRSLYRWQEVSDSCGEFL
jgi:hypothetical protein